MPKLQKNITENFYIYKIMSLTGNPYVYYSVATAQAEFALWQQVLSDIAKAGQSYAVPGRTFTRANLSEVKKTVAQLGQAIAFLTGKQIVTATPFINPAGATAILPFGSIEGIGG